MAQKISFVIADDDQLFRELTLQYLRQIPDLECLGVFEDAISAISGIQKMHPDLLIADVEMPMVSGVQLVKSLSQIPLIIFISSYKQYALDAFEVDAVDFLTKPLVPERLLKAIDKVRNLIELKRNIAPNDALKIETDDSFFIREKSAYVKVHYADVNFIESLADFVSIFLTNGSKKTALVSLKNLEQQLPSSHFIRISRTHIVNKQKITALDNNTIALDKIQLQIGKTYNEQVVQSVLGNSAIKRFI